MYISTNNRDAGKVFSSKKIFGNVFLCEYDSGKFRFLLNNNWLAIGIGRKEISMRYKNIFCK